MFHGYLGIYAASHSVVTHYKVDEKLCSQRLPLNPTSQWSQYLQIVRKVPGFHIFNTGGFEEYSQDPSIAPAK
jgi:hypothetical protein